MSFAPIALTMPQYETYANWWLKAYEQGTTTPLSMATDAGGLTTLAKAQLDSEGFPLAAVGTRFIPFIDGDYDLWVIPTEKEANKNILSNAFQLADNLNTNKNSEDFLPATDVTYDIGSSTFSWQDLYLGGNIFDQNGNEVLGLSETASAVNYVQVQNSITTVGPTISPAGDDANIDLNIESKGTGSVKINDDTDITGDTSVTGDISVTGTVDGVDIAANVGTTNVKLNTKVIDIGDWDMDTTGDVSVTHGLTQSTIRSISITIRADGGATFYDFASSAYTLGIGTGSNFVRAVASTVDIFRFGGGFFDSASFSSTSFNRGWITIQYTD